jgi:hypothetical protein
VSCGRLVSCARLVNGARLVRGARAARRRHVPAALRPTATGPGLTPLQDGTAATAPLAKAKVPGPAGHEPAADGPAGHEPAADGRELDIRIQQANWEADLSE